MEVIPGGAVPKVFGEAVAAGRVQRPEKVKTARKAEAWSTSSISDRLGSDGPHCDWRELDTPCLRRLRSITKKKCQLWPKQSIGVRCTKPDVWPTSFDTSTKLWRRRQQTHGGSDRAREARAHDAAEGRSSSSVISGMCEGLRQESRKRRRESRSCWYRRGLSLSMSKILTPSA